MSVYSTTLNETLNLNEIFLFLTDLVQRCGRIITDGYNREKALTDKISFADFATETDLLVEKTLIESIRQKYPKHEFIGEESTTEAKKVVFTDNPVWIIDPIDGTTNFVHKLPHCSISIGFYVNQEAQIGIVYNPITDQLFSAIKGQGALLNGRGIKHTGEKNLNKSQIITEFGSQRNSLELDAKVKNMRALVEKSHSIRCLGGAALNGCFVAMGAADVYYEYGVHIWDISACALICKEAGCYVSDPNGSKLNLLNRAFLVTSTKELADQVIPLLTHVLYECD